VRILFLTENFWPYIGGVEVLGAKLLPALCKRGYEFLVITSHYYLDLPDEEQYQGIPIYRFPLLSALANSNVAQLLKTVRQITKLKNSFQPHLIHVNSVGLNALLHLQTTEASPAPVLVTLLGLKEAVDFVGWVAPDKVPMLMNTATVVVMPSRWEGLPIVALEASLMARPIVASRVEGLTEVVVHQQTGLLVEKENSEALAEALAFLLDHPEFATVMGQTARRYVQEVFSFERCMDAYDTLYRRLATAE
jgi:glycosyltransferase involved in cell wall biosynthesis